MSALVVNLFGALYLINQITWLLDKYKIDYKPIFANESAYDDIVEKVIRIVS